MWEVTSFDAFAQTGLPPLQPRLQDPIDRRHPKTHAACEQDLSMTMRPVFRIDVNFTMVVEEYRTSNVYLQATWLLCLSAFLLKFPVQNTQTSHSYAIIIARVVQPYRYTHGVRRTSAHLLKLVLENGRKY